MVKNDKNEIEIDFFSVTSLLLLLRVNGQNLSTATGFVVRFDDEDYLITNWHVLNGRNANTGKLLSEKTGAFPRTVVIYHRSKNSLSSWVAEEEELYDKEDKPLWLEHPMGCKVDVVALKLRNHSSEIKTYPLDISLAQKSMHIAPAMSVSIIGYPFGETAGAVWPIWKTGHIASEPMLDYNLLPCFLIDATTRAGMSGSPVVKREYGTWLGSDKELHFSKDGKGTKFLGIYSGRIHDLAEVGIVWRPQVIYDILESKGQIQINVQ